MKNLIILGCMSIALVLIVIVLWGAYRTVWNPTTLSGTFCCEQGFLGIVEVPLYDWLTPHDLEKIIESHRFDGFVSIAFQSDGTFRKSYYAGTRLTAEEAMGLGKGTYQKNGDLITCSDGCVYKLEHPEGAVGVQHLLLIRVEPSATRPKILGLKVTRIEEGNRLDTLSPPETLPYVLEYPMLFVER